MKTENPAPEADIVAQAEYEADQYFDDSALGQLLRDLATTIRALRAERVPEGWRPTAAERQSGYDRLRFAEGLIQQLPPDHDGRNTWLLNYGRSDEAVERRKKRGIRWDDETQAAETIPPTKAPPSLAAAPEPPASRASPAEGEVAELVAELREPVLKIVVRTGESGAHSMRLNTPSAVGYDHNSLAEALAQRDEAADALERLTRRVATQRERAELAEKDARKSLEQLAAADARVKELEAACNHSEAVAMGEAQRATAADARLDAALEVLEPFAALAERLDKSGIPDGASISYDPDTLNPTVRASDCRAARDFIRTAREGE